jgi:energy-converting hydrogenase Eha subunit G
VSGMRGPSVCWLGGGGISGVGIGWCVWVFGRLYVQGSRPFSCICLYPGRGCDLLNMLYTTSAILDQTLTDTG